MIGGCLLYQVYCFGSLQILDLDGVDLAPKGSKARGLIALLLDAQNMLRGRRWLESKLWSDRASEQASGSLRQTLAEIRTAFGDHRDLLQSNRIDVWLEKDKIDCDLSINCTFRNAHRELLEGLDVRDPEFEDWLRDFRTRHEMLHAPAVQQQNAGIRIECVTSEDGTRSERLMGNIIADQVAKIIEERFTGWRETRAKGWSDDSASDIRIHCEVTREAASDVVFIRAEQISSRYTLFSDYRDIQRSGANTISDKVVASLAHLAAQKVSAKLPLQFDLKRPEASATGFANLALKRLWTFEKENIEKANALMSNAYDTDQNGIYLAWRAFIQMAKIVDSLETDSYELVGEVQELARKSIEKASDNSLVLALASLSQIMVQDDLSTPAELSRQAVDVNSNNLFALQSMAMAKSSLGDCEAAYRLSKFCQNALPHDDIRHLWDLYHCLVCISVHRFEEAREAGKRAALRCPSFVAPQRQLISLNAHLGDMNAARKNLKALKKLEPEFSLDSYKNDPDYPVHSLRKSGLILTVPNFLEDES